MMHSSTFPKFPTFSTCSNHAAIENKQLTKNKIKECGGQIKLTIDN